MKDYISLSTTPGMEDCAPLGDGGYMKNARLEAHAYQRQLQRTYGMNPVGTKFRIKRCPHDFGTYLDLEFHYDDENQRHVAYMAVIDEGCLHWDERAIEELKQRGYSHLPRGAARKRPTSRSSEEDGYTTDNGPTGDGDVCYSDADPCL
jgi:hypothetical protein